VRSEGGAECQAHQKELTSADSINGMGFPGISDMMEPSSAPPHMAPGTVLTKTEPDVGWVSGGVMM
jgi:hypothetical protein